MLLDLLVEAGVKRVAPRLFGSLRQLDADCLCRSNGLCVVGDRTKINADILLDGIYHRQPRPAGGQIDRFAHPVQLIGSEVFLGEGGVNALSDVHHVVEIGVGLVELDRGEFGVVLGVHALVAENTADLVHAVHAADDQALQRKLGRDTHIHIDIERIVVRNKGSCRRAARDGIENGRFDLDIAHIVQIIPQMLDELRTDDEIPLDLRVHDQVDVALAVARLLVGQAVELLGQRQQGLGQQRDGLRAHGHFAALRAEDLALDADDIADVVFLEAVIFGLVHFVLAGVELDAACFVLQVAEGHLAHAALGHETARNGDGLALHLVKMLLDLLCGRGADEAGDGKRVHALRLQLRELFAADLDLVAEADLRGRVLLIPVFLFHSYPLFLIRYFSTVRILYLSTPMGASTSTMSPTLWPSSALPNGESSEMRHSMGLASCEPTMA